MRKNKKEIEQRSEILNNIRLGREFLKFYLQFFHNKNYLPEISSSRYFFVSSTTTLESPRSPTRFGKAMSPFIMSAKVQTKSNFITAPAITTSVKRIL